jgi:hypothetical protein
MSLIFDLETGPLTEQHIRKFAPAFTPEPHPGEFNSATVKYGRTKDPEKRAAILKENEDKHAALVESYASDTQQAEQAHWKKIFENAALDPALGQVLAIGAMDAASGRANVSGQENGQDEAFVIAKFWQKYVQCRGKGRKLIGHCIKTFDLWFLVNRSRILQVDVPGDVFDGRFWSPLFQDTADYWSLGRKWNGGSEFSLDYIGKILGLGGKMCGPDGKPMAGDAFAKLWNGTPEEREQARAYLLRDLELTAQVAMRLGVAV